MRIERFSMLAGWAALVCAAPWSSISAQAVPQAQVQQFIQQNPELVRQRIQASGLTPDQIRARLEAAGYSRTLLDPFIAGGPETALQAAVNEEVLRALDLLAPPQVRPEGVQPVPVESGPERAPAAEARTEGLEIFGLNVFRGRTTQFQPLLSGPVPPNYRIGPGDVMVLVITGDVEFVHELSVTREGFIVIPQVGQVFVNGLTMEQLNELLRRRLGQAYSGIRTGTTRFDVTIARLRTNQVYVIGEVAQPGAYQLASVATVLNALYAAGGPTERGNFRDIQVRRQGQIVARLDLYDYLLRGATDDDIVLEQGDVVFVPVHGVRAAVTGAVIRPAIYELQPGETLSDLVRAAGGFRATAALNRISVYRIVPPERRVPGSPPRVVVDVRLEPGTETGRDGSAAPAGPGGVRLRGVQVPPFEIEDGDSVVVDFLPIRASRNFVDIKGNVYLPGRYGLEPGMRLSRLIELAGGLRPATYAGRAHIERLNLADSTRFLVEVALPEDSIQPYPEDIALQEYDIVTIYGREEFRNERTVSIGGMVNRPGTYPYRNGMTLRDLVMMARGLKDGAYLDTAEISRLPADRSGGTLAIKLRVPMDSSYLFEPEGSTYPRLPGLPAPKSGAPEVPLEPFDHVLILPQPEWELQRTVSIEGEVKFPGPYALLKKDERLSDLVSRAGGLLPTAFPGGARLVREFADAGRVDVDLEAALKRPGGPADVILRPGDRLIIPEYVATVRVEGAVNSPTSVLYRPGAGLDYYIANAGGYARNADKGRVHVRYANGSARVKSRFLFFTSSPEPGPGSVITVPVKPEGEPFNPTQFFASLAQIAASVVAIIVVATRP
ncbi:Polysialic acid transport protein KpsD [bacterium HR33]|nr:Polysialic acid transport protein KpsD [bacterium HR33]